MSRSSRKSGRRIEALLKRAIRRQAPDLLPFTFRRLDGSVLLTNDAGRFTFLTEEEFLEFVGGSLDRSGPLAARLRELGFLEGPDSAERLGQEILRAKTHLTTGPSLHILILTLRCNHRCVYCQASRRPMDTPGVDMSLDVADRVLDVVFSSPAPALTIEFQGGEPLANFPVLEHVVEQARRRAGHRTLYLTLVSNLSLMDEERLAFLVDNNVAICTSLDGPKHLHDANRPWSGGSSYEVTVRWMDRILEEYARRGLPEGQVNALLTVSRRTLETPPEEIVDEYVRRGIKVLHLRPVQPFGFAGKTWQRVAVPPGAFLDYYARAFSYLLDLNRKGVEIQEKTASLLLTKILTGRDPNYMDLRSPCGAGLGQLAYDHDGSVYPCDEARMVAAMGDPVFRLGHVAENSYREIAEHDTVRALAVASCLEGQVGCSTCAYKPYCGVCPVAAYALRGSIFESAPHSDRCRLQMGIQDLLFRTLRQEGSEVGALLEKWTWDRSPLAAQRARD